MKKLLIAVVVFLICSATFADDKKAEVEKLLGRLQREPFHAELICEQIVKLGKDALPALEAASKDNDFATREAAQRSIAAIAWRITPRCFYTVGSGLDEIVHFTRAKLIDPVRTAIKELDAAADLDGLVGTVRSGGPPAALMAIEAIERLGSERKAAQKLLDSVRSQDWFYAGALLARSPKEVLPLCLEKLRSRKENDRLAAATALVIGPSPEAHASLLKALENKSSLVRLKAAEALGAAGDKRALDALAKRVREDTDYTVRAEAAWALGMLDGAHKATTALVGALKDRDSQVRTRAIESLAVAGTKAAACALGAFARDGAQDTLARSRAIRAIGQIGGQDALENLKPLLTKSDDAYSSVPTVTGLLGKVALPFLRETLSKTRESDFNMFRKCRLALRAMGAEAVPLLLDLLESEKNILRLVGRTLLQALTGKDFEYDRARWEEHLEKNPPK